VVRATVLGLDLITLYEVWFKQFILKQDNLKGKIILNWIEGYTKCLDCQGVLIMFSVYCFYMSFAVMLYAVVGPICLLVV
jgi:hypothetical protein